MSLPNISHSDWLLPCHSRGVSGWSVLSGECECMFVCGCGYVCRHVWHMGCPDGALDMLAPCVSRQAPVELTSYFEPFHLHQKSLSSHLPCSHFPCPPTWNWRFTALIAKVVLSFRASTFYHERLFCQIEQNLDNTPQIMWYPLCMIQASLLGHHKQPEQFCVDLT